MDSIFEKYERIKTKKIGKEKYRYCLDCKWEENEWRIKYPRLHRDNKVDVRLAKEYCEKHKHIYSHHKCEPKWCDKCKYLINYEIIIDHSKWER